MLQVLQDGSEVKLQVRHSLTPTCIMLDCMCLAAQGGSCSMLCLCLQRNALSVLEMGPPETLDDPSQGSSSDTEAREPKLGTPHNDGSNDALSFNYTHCFDCNLQSWL
jgi:hypothetical protein